MSVVEPAQVEILDVLDVEPENSELRQDRQLLGQDRWHERHSLMANS